jgi:hypothetical protein
MSQKPARPATWGSRPGLDDLRVTAESGLEVPQNPYQKQALSREHLTALYSTRFADLAPLVAVGIRWETIATAVPAFARIRVSNDATTFEPDESGGGAFIVPVRVENPITPEAFDPVRAVRDGAIVDLAGFHPHHPDRWALRRDVAEWLGAIEPQYLDPEPVPIWRSPLSWLRADCRGLVLLGDRASQYRILSGLCSIVAEDAQHAAELQSILAQPWSAPRVIVGVQETRHAA